MVDFYWLDEFVVVTAIKFSNFFIRLEVLLGNEFYVKKLF